MMQTISNISSNLTTNESKSTNEFLDENQTNPPTYQNAIEKLASQPSLPPSYTEIDGSSVVYINNYPGPPLSDGIIQITASNPNLFHSEMSSLSNTLSKRVRIYLTINAILTILFGFIAIGLQIGLLASHSIVYYYYGFWAGALTISIGISSLMFINRYQMNDLGKYFRSFLYQTVFIAVVFGFGLIIILTDTCDDGESESDGNDDACRNSYKVLNVFLVTVIALTLLQTIMNTLLIGYLKRRYLINLNLPF